MKRLGLLGFLLAIALAGCEGGASGGDDDAGSITPPPAPAPPPASGTVTPFATVPQAAAPPVGVTLHESSHLVFRLTWAPGPMLVDEYTDGAQDAACIMEGQTRPWRWCSDANHTAQSSQPHSCWRQILLDYPNFSHLGVDTAAGPPPAPTAVYNDAP